MTTWIQVYEPTPYLLLSSFLASIPILLLLGLLASGKVTASWAALSGLIAALVIAIVFYRPAMDANVTTMESWGNWSLAMAMAALHGAGFGLLPIGWIVFSAIFLYNLTVTTGQFEIVKESVASVSDDRRLQALLIAFCFGAFVEGAAGFGTPVAISAALMLGAGFRPLYAAGLALLANTSPVAFGALGTPILMLGEVTGLDATVLSAMAGRQLPFFSLAIPIWLVWVMSGWRGVVGVWPALLVCGGSFALVQFLTANYHGPWLVDVAGGLISLIALALFLQYWQPKTTWHFPEETEKQNATETPKKSYTQSQIVFAWMPWVFLSLFVFLWGIPLVKQSLKRTSPSFPIPHLHQKISRGPAVVAPRWDEKTVATQIGMLANPTGQGVLSGVTMLHPGLGHHPEDARYSLDWLAGTGTSIFLAAILSAFWLRISSRQFLAVFVRTMVAIRFALITIACMLAIAFVTRYSGMDASMGLVLQQYTGALYPFFAALLGWLGVALTGSDTSSNALFGSLQTMTAEQLVAEGYLPLSSEQAKVLMATANSTGGVMGKMIDAQSIVVASAATRQVGGEGAILRFVFWHSIVLAMLIGLLVLFQAYVWTSVIPT